MRDDKAKPTVGGVPCEMFIYQFVDKQLYQMTIMVKQDDFDQVVKAIAGKYGPPTSKEERTYQNGFGAKFTGEVSVWSNGVSEITAFERAGSVDTSALIFSHKALAKTAREQ